MNNNKSGFWKGKKVLVTGAGGFIGYNLCLKLKEMNAEVTAFSRTVRDELKENGIEQHKGEITDQELIQKLVDKVDIIFHLAANPSIWKSMNDPMMDCKTNIIGTLTVLNAAKNDQKKVIFPSTIALYRNADTEQECDEDTKICPDNFYSLSKYTCEQYCLLFYKLFRIPISIARLSYVYGPNLKRGVIYDIVKQIVQEKKKKIELFMLPENKLNFIHIDDAIDALLIIASNQNAVGEIFNIGSDKDNNINEIIQFVGKQCGCKIEVALHEHADKTKINFNVNYEKAKKVLDWKPIYNLKQGLLKIIDNIKVS
ncbi:MAG: NAD(P)-dependent oxidoreductase [Candidatus Woesearchaeota archaeon]